jgi:DNA-binding NtrC family response regulator
MRHPLLVVYESDRRLAALLEKSVEENGWMLREPRQPEACLRLLRQGGAASLVLRLGRDLERELGLLERVAWLYPDVATVLVGDAAHQSVAGLAWDLGASYVLLPPTPRERLPEIVIGLMRELPDSGS